MKVSCGIIINLALTLEPISGEGEEVDDEEAPLEGEEVGVGDALLLGV